MAIIKRVDNPFILKIVQKDTPELEIGDDWDNGQPYPVYRHLDEQLEEGQELYAIVEEKPGKFQLIYVGDSCLFDEAFVSLFGQEFGDHVKFYAVEQQLHGKAQSYTEGLVLAVN